MTRQLVARNKELADMGKLSPFSSMPSRMDSGNHFYLTCGKEFVMTLFTSLRVQSSDGQHSQVVEALIATMRSASFEALMAEKG
jgi:hypothetical protein